MPPEATREGATTERLMGILGWSDAKPETSGSTDNQPNQAEAAEEAKPEQTTEVETQESTETEATAEATEEAVEQSDDAQEELPPPSTLTDLAERLGLDPDKLYEIKAKTKIDGQEGEATLAQLLKSYQLEGHLTRKSMEIAEKQKAIEQDAQKRDQEAQERINYLDASLQIATNILNERYQNVNWEDLKAKDPNLFNTRYIEYQQHQQQLNNAYQALQIEKQKESLVQQKKFAEMLEAESKKLSTVIPEWADGKVAKKDRSEIREYLKEIGFNDDEIGQVYDHRLVLVVRDALKAKKLATAKPEVLKKVTQAPKLVKPGSKTSKDEVKSDRLRELKKQHKAGNKQAGIAWLKESGLV